MSNPPPPAIRSRLPQNSFLFEKIIPVSMIVLGLVTAVLILFALGVLVGLIRF